MTGIKQKGRIMLLGTFCLIASSCVNIQKESKKTDETTIDAEKTCMNRVIEQDNILGAKRNHDCETISLSETIQRYADELEKLDFHQCPENFTKSFEKHRTDWLAMKEITDKYPELRGEMHDLFDVLEKSEDAERFRILLKAIWDSWAEVEEAMKE